MPSPPPTGSPEPSLGRRAALRALAGSAVVGLSGCSLRDDDDATATPTEQRLPDPDDRTTFLGGAEAAAISERVDADADPWATAWGRFQHALASAMMAEPRSVVDNGAPDGGEGDPHAFGTDAPYQAEDGVFSEDADRGDYSAAIDMGEWTRDAGLAYALTGEERYARRAIEFLRAWCVDPETRMAPSAVNHGPHQEELKGNHSIELYITIPAMFYGASFVADHPRWDAVADDGIDALDEWAGRFLGSVEEEGTVTSNNVGAWQIAARAATAAYLDDGAALERAFDDWRGDVLRQVTPEGGLRGEQRRSRSLFYSAYALKALTLTAEVARHRGVDLYGHARDADGSSVLRTVADFHAPYLLDPSTWPHQEIGFGHRELMAAASVYELLNSQWGDDRYRDVVRSAGRPVREERLLGPVTLTHGDRFDLE